MSRWRLAQARKFIGSGARMSVAQVAGGTFSAQLVALLALPLLSRLYTPEAFGALAVVLAVSMLLSGVVSLRLELAIPNAVEEHQADSVAWLALGVSALLTAALLVLAWVPGAGLLSLALSPDYLVWTLIATLLTAAFTVLSQLFIWRGQFSLLGLRAFWQGLVATLSSVVFGLAGMVWTGLLLGQVLGRVAAIGLMAASVLPGRRTEVSGTRLHWRSLWKYPALFMPAGILNTLGGQLPLLLTAAWFGAEAAGLLGVAQRVLVLPAAIVGLAISQVFLGRLAEVRRSGLPHQLKVVRGAARILLPVGILLTLGALALAPLMSWLLGGEWVGVSDFVRASCIVYGTAFLATPLQQVLVANARGGINLILDGSRVALVFLAAAAATKAGLSAADTVFAMSVAQAINYALTTLAAWWSAREWDKQHSVQADR